jgi:hypothetical protein
MMNCFQLDELANKLSGVTPAPNNPNLYFVAVCGSCILATTSFPVALNVYENVLRSGKYCSLHDRRQGKVADYNPTTGHAYDDTGLDYYQQQKWGWSDEQFAELKAKRDAAVYAAKDAELSYILELSKTGQWIVWHGLVWDHYFYVRAVLPGGLLRGYYVQVKHAGKKKIKRVGCETIEQSTLKNWRVASDDAVAHHKLESYL